jgi:hypothetical protein
MQEDHDSKVNLGYIDISCLKKPNKENINEILICATIWMSLENFAFKATKGQTLCDSLYEVPRIGKLTKIKK